MKIKLRSYPTPETSDLYEFRMALFDNVDPEEFLLFVCNFNITLEASGTLDTAVKVQYLRTLFCGKKYIRLTRCLLTWKVKTL